MNTLIDPFLYINFIIFLIVVFIAFYIPGDFIIKKSKLPLFSHMILATVIGMVLWTWQGFIVGYLQIRFFSYIYLSIFLIIWFIYKRYKIFKIKNIYSIDYVSLGIVLIGIIIQLLPVIGFGFLYDRGMYLCCGNREDFIYHLALTSSIVNKFPPVEPGMFNIPVTNYHYWSNLLSAEMVRVFKLPLIYTQFQYLSLLITSLLGLTVYTFANSLAITKNYNRWLLFFIFFGADAILFLILFLGKDITLITTVSSLEDGSSFLVNPPRAFSIVIAFAALTFLTLWVQNKKIIFLLISVFLFASTIGFKVYTGLFGLTGFFLLAFFLAYKKRYKEIICLLLFIPVGSIIYFSTNASSGGLFFAPFHLAKDFIIQPAFGLIRLELARQVFLEHNNYIRVLMYEIFFSFLFTISIFGTKIIAFFQSYSSLKRIKIELHIFLVFGILVSYGAGMGFLQESGGANIFNFIVSAWVFISIYAALSTEYWQSKLLKPWKYIFIIFIVGLTIPRILISSYSTINAYFKFDYLFIPNEYISSFKYISDNLLNNGLIAVDPDLGFDRGTPYVYAFTQKPMFLSGNNILESHQIDTKKRNITIKNIFKSNDSYLVANEINNNKIRYIILTENDFLTATESAYFLKTTYTIEKIKILEVNSHKLIEFLTVKLY